MGCASGMNHTVGGCYGDCYAARTARRYGIDFKTTILRRFENWQHQQDVMREIHRIKMPFIRIGCSGDPSEDWKHTLKVLSVFSTCNTELVIITRHWNLLTDDQLSQISKMNMCINTSVSALDEPVDIEKSLSQFERVKSHCKSVLRIISCDFNMDNNEGSRRSKIQDSLFKKSPTIDTVFRPTKSNRFVQDEIINVTKVFFNSGKQLASKFNRKTYMGKCETCMEMCGVNLSDGTQYTERPGVIKQTDFNL
jgi:hypothetical protein